MDRRLILFRTGPRLCALPVEHVVEVMRPPPTEPVRGAPRFVVGAAMVRGRSMPIIDMQALLSGSPLAEPTRMMNVRVGQDRSVGVLASEVHGVIDDDGEGERSPLFADANTIEKIGALDRGLLTILSAAQLLPESFWQRWAHGEDAP